jgi:HK97 family phage portal protein
MPVTLTSKYGWESVGSVWTGIPNSLDDASSVAFTTYRKSELVLACVRELENAVAEGTLETGFYNPEGEWTSTPEDKILNLFYDNKNYSYAEIIKLTVARLSLTGCAYLLLDKLTNQSGIGNLYPAPTSVLHPKYNGIELAGYELNTGDKTRDIEDNNVARVMYRDPQSWNGFISPLQAALRRCYIDGEQAKLTSEVLKNRSIPGQIYEYDKMLTSTQIDQLKDILKRETSGETENRGNAIILQNGLKLAQQVKVDDIDFSGLSALNETRICMVYQVPPILIGAKAGLDRATYSNYGHARSSFYKETVSSLWTMIASAWTKDLLRAYSKNNLEFRFNTTQVEALQEGQNDKATRVSLLFEKGVIDRTEARNILGMANPEDIEQENISTVDGVNADTITEEKVLDGAQVTAATQIIQAVADRLLPRDSAIGQLMVMFNLSNEQANLMMGSVGISFKPTVAEEGMAKAITFHSFGKPA